MKIDNKIMSQFQMLGSRIVSVNLRNDFISSDSIQSGKKNLDISHEIVAVNQLEDQTYLGVIHLHVSIRIASEKLKYTFKMVVEGAFCGPQEMDPETFEKMLSINGLAALYGVARAEVRSISAQVFADGGILLPMVDITRYSKLINNNVKKSDE